MQRVQSVISRMTRHGLPAITLWNVPRRHKRYETRPAECQYVATTLTTETIASRAFLRGEGVNFA